MSRKPKFLEARHHVAARSKVIAGIGPYAVRHVAKKPQYECTAGLSVLYKFYRDVEFTDLDTLGGPVVRYVRCRKCDGCLRARRAMWTARAISETETTSLAGRRTWFLTATHKLRPQEGADEMFESEITRALKRLRKVSSFRYLLIFERHKDGFPHCYALIHEGRTLMYADFRMVFSRIGFFEAKLLKGDPRRAASYVSKYMSKDMMVDTGESLQVQKTPVFCRVRASFQYGQGSIPATKEVSEAETSLPCAAFAAEGFHRDRTPAAPQGLGEALLDWQGALNAEL